MERGEKMSDYVQVGVTACRDPKTGDFLPAVPIYVERSDFEKRPVQVPDLSDIGRILAGKMRDYRNACKKEGLKL